MYTLEQAEFWALRVAVALSISMLSFIALLLIYSWLPAKNHHIAVRLSNGVDRWVKYGELNAKLLATAALVWIVVRLIEVPV